MTAITSLLNCLAWPTENPCLDDETSNTLYFTAQVAGTALAVTLFANRTRIADAVRTRIGTPTSLHWAAQEGNLDEIRRCRHIGVNTQDHRGNTPLHYAANHPAAYQELLRRGADPELKDNDGDSPRDLLNCCLRLNNAFDRLTAFVNDVKRLKLVPTKVKIQGDDLLAIPELYGNNHNPATEDASANAGRST